ncbi:MAG: hypothetical protein AB7I37_26215 [Pirellulales bacterium]
METFTSTVGVVGRTIESPGHEPAPLPVAGHRNAGAANLVWTWHGLLSERGSEAGSNEHETEGKGFHR